MFIVQRIECFQSKRLSSLKSKRLWKCLVQRSGVFSIETTNLNLGTRSTLKWYLNQLSSLSQQKVLQSLAKVLILTIFGYLGPNSKSSCSTYNQSLENPWSVSWWSLGTLCYVLSFLSSKGCRGGQQLFCNSTFFKTLILASCDFVGRPPKACYDRLVFFQFS